MSLPKAAWAEIAKLWQLGDEPISQIAARFGVSSQKIVGHARRERWPPRSTSKKSRAPKPVADERGHAESARRDGEQHTTNSSKPTRSGHAVADQDPAAARKAMVERLFDAMDTKLTAIEKRIAVGGDATPADSERTTRALNTLIRSLEKLSDVEGKITASKRRKDGKRRQASVDPERRRQELAGRIERLLKRR